MKVKVRYEWEYARRRFVESGVIVEGEEVLHVDVTGLTSETRQSLLEFVGLDVLGEPDSGRTGPEDPDLDLEWAGPRGNLEGQFLLDGPPAGPSEWDEVLGRFFEARRGHLRRLREHEDAKIRELMAGWQKELSGGDREGVGSGSGEVPPRRRRRRRRIDTAFDPFLWPSDLRDYEHATPELLHEAEELMGRVRSMREERAAKAEAERREQEAQEHREREEQWAAEGNRRAEEKERQAEEKRAWIERHGSEHLREAIAAGYDCRELYARERAALEWPMYKPNVQKKAKWKRLSSPSPEAFAEAQRVGGRVVWLEIPVAPPAPEGETSQDLWSPCEAVVIGGYLDRYHLVREIR